MATINEKLQSIKNSKDAIKAAIIAKGGDCSTNKLSEFATAVSNIPSGGETIYDASLTFDDEYNVTEIILPSSFDSIIPESYTSLRYSLKSNITYYGFDFDISLACSCINVFDIEQCVSFNIVGTVYNCTRTYDETSQTWSDWTIELQETNYDLKFITNGNGLIDASVIVSYNKQWIDDLDSESHSYKIKVTVQCETERQSAPGIFEHISSQNVQCVSFYDVTLKCFKAFKRTKENNIWSSWVLVSSN